MFITRNLLYRDTRYFLCNNIAYIVLIVCFTTFFTMFLDTLITPDIKKISFLYEVTPKNFSLLLDIIKNMNIEQKNILLQSCISKIFSSLINNTLLVGSTISLITILSSGKKITLSLFFSILKKLFNNLLILTFILILILKISFICFIIPGILISTLLSLSPIILCMERSSILKSMLSSIYIVRKRFKIIFPSVSLCLFLKFLCLSIPFFYDLSHIHMIFLFFFFTQNLITLALIIYLSRFYMLFRIS
ncbi:YciC family protein [Buchnera aphidicola]|uniref:YciC family protein n=1 Tax=Buchnera aphidicola TaxID=9 RepID=UPI003463F397